MLFGFLSSAFARRNPDLIFLNSMQDDHRIDQNKNRNKSKAKTKEPQKKTAGSPSGGRAGKFPFFSALKKDWILLFRGFQFKSLIPAKLQGYEFREAQPSSSPERSKSRLQQLSEAKRTLNLRIEKVQKQLELAELAAGGALDEDFRQRLIEEGQKASRELQILELEISELRRQIKQQGLSLASSGPSLPAR